jgi:hypothetical protein
VAHSEGFVGLECRDCLFNIKFKRPGRFDGSDLPHPNIHNVSAIVACGRLLLGRLFWRKSVQQPSLSATRLFSQDMSRLSNANIMSLQLHVLYLTDTLPRLIILMGLGKETGPRFSSRDYRWGSECGDPLLRRHLFCVRMRS